MSASVRLAGERLSELGGGTGAKELADLQPLDATLEHFDETMPVTGL